MPNTSNNDFILKNKENLSSMIEFFIGNGHFVGSIGYDNNP